jgi:hypothetical protein
MTLCCCHPPGRRIFALSVGRSTRSTGYLVQAGLELPDRRTLRTHSGYPAISGYRAVYGPGWSLRLCGGGLAGRG